MIRKYTLLFLLCFGVLKMVTAQPVCGFDSYHQHMMNTNSAYAQSYNQFNTDVAQWLNTYSNINSLLTVNSSGDTVVEVPVVVHVLHTGGSIGTIYNVTDIRIKNTIDYLNKTYQATWSAYPNTSNGGTKIPLQFKLATRSPSCGSTSGITRMDVTSVSGYGASGYDYAQYGVRRNNGIGSGVRDDSLKRLIQWPPERYYNIWVVNKIDGNDGTSGTFIAGYATLPSNNPGFPPVDGTVMLATQMNINRITLPHEVGHAFGLLHTFEGSHPSSSTNKCPANNNCTTDGDMCCDTEPHYLYSPGSCYSGQNNPCTGTTFGDATAKNFMNYANCQNRFTNDQGNRVIASLLATTIRRSLISSAGALAIPSTGLPTVCTPGITNPSNSFNSGPRRVKVEDNAPGTRLYMDVLTNGGYNDDGNVSYIDKTCEHQLRLQAGKTYKLTFESASLDKGAAFIDYNNDGILGNTTGERLSVTDQSSGSVHVATFTVPLTANSCTPVRMRIISDRTSGYIDSCSNRVYGQTEDYEVLISGGTNGNSGGTVTISNPPKGGNPSCNNTLLTFKATPSSGVTLVGYQWFINDTLVSGQTADSFQSTVFKDKDTVRVAMYYSGLCGVDTAYSDSVIVERRISIPPAVALSISKGANPTCANDTITFKALLVSNPGASPTFKWRSNGVYIPGATGQTFDAYNRIGESISVVMYSSAGAPCATPDTALSDTAVIRDTTRRPVANIALTIGTNPGCAGQMLQFTATPQTGGTAPSYQWSVNGSNVLGATGSTYNTSTLSNGDLVRVTMVSNSACASPKTVTSDSIKVIHQKITADITIAQTTGKNPTCEGKSVIFSANTNNAGQNPQFQWMINGIAISSATSPIYVTDSLRQGDRVQCVLNATDPCVANPHDTSNVLNMQVTHSKRPKVSVAITGGKNPGCLDSLVEFTATPKDLGANPNFQWIINGVPATSGNVFSTTTLLDGNTVTVRANQTDGGCYLPDTVYSTPMVMKRSTTPIAPVISLIGNMMVTNFDSSFVWFGPKGEIAKSIGKSAYPDTIGAYWAVTNNNGCWSAPSNILRITLLDISSIDISGLDVYPNPTSDKVILDWKGSIVNYTVEVYTAIGQLVKRESAMGVSKKEISMAGLAAGNYFFLLKDGSGKTGIIKVGVK